MDCHIIAFSHCHLQWLKPRENKRSGNEISVVLRQLEGRESTKQNSHSVPTLMENSQWEHTGGMWLGGDDQLGNACFYYLLVLLLFVFSVVFRSPCHKQTYLEASQVFHWHDSLPKTICAYIILTNSLPLQGKGNGSAFVIPILQLWRVVIFPLWSMFGLW